MTPVVRPAYALEARIEAGGLDVQVRSYQSVAAAYHRETDAAAYMLLSTSRSFRGSYALEPDGDAYADVGPIFLLPGDTPLWFRSPAGSYRSVRCRFSGDRYRALAQPAEWNRDLLRACFDLRGGRLAELLGRLAQEAVTPGFAAPALVEALGLQLAVELGRQLRPAAAPAPDGSRGLLSGTQLRLIEQRVHDSDGTPPTITDLADLLEMSSRHLLRLFRNTTGRTVRDYVEDVRLERAKALLAGRMPLKEIAWRLGFSGPSSFSTAFRKATGCTPLAYRRGALG